MFLVQKYTAYRAEYKAAQAEQAKKKVTEKELCHLNHKIDKLLSQLEEHEPEMATNQDEECVVCIMAKASMTTFPCAHRVVCRKCFVKTIQMAVSQRLLPLRCVICRAKILHLKQGSSNKVPQSASLYSVASNSSTASGSSRVSGYSVNSAKTDPFPSFRRAQMARIGYQPLRSVSPPPSFQPTKTSKQKTVELGSKVKSDIEPNQVPNRVPLKGKAKLSQDFQREFRMGIQTASKTSGRVRCCRDLVSEAEAWKKDTRTSSSAQGRATTLERMRS